jgi:sugar lactone lactonase YvrE
MKNQRHGLALGVALALAGCVVPAHTTSHSRVPTSVAPAVLSAILPGNSSGLISNNAGSIVANNAGNLISNNGGALTGKTKIPAGIIANNAGSLISDSGGSIVANNAGNLISDHGGALISNNSAGLTGKTKFELLQAQATLQESPAAGFPVTIVDAAGKPVLDDKGQPYHAVTGKDGTYTFARTPRGANLIVRVDLPAAVGPMFAYLPNSTAGTARQADVGGASTLVLSYVLEKFVKNQSDPNATLQKLPGDVEATTRAKATSALIDAPDLASFKPEAIVPKVEALGRDHAEFAQQVEIVRKLLVAGLSDVGDGQLASAVALSDPRAALRLPDGTLLVVERNGHRIRRIDPKTKRITTFAGKDGAGGLGDGGPAKDAFIDRPVAIAADAQGNVYVGDFGHNRVRRIDYKTGIITTVAGTDKRAADFPNTVPAEGAVANTFNLDFPDAMTCDTEGRLIFRESSGVFRIEANGKLHPLVWQGDGYPESLITGPDGKVYGLEKVTGRIEVLVGDGFTDTGLPAQACSDSARIALDAKGMWYFVDDEKLMALAPGTTTWKPVPITTKHGFWENLLVEADGIILLDGQFNRVWHLPLGGGDLTSLAGLEVANADALSSANLSLNRPTAMIAEGAGRLLVADGLNGVVWERRADGLYYRFAGGRAAKGSDTDFGDGGSARAAALLKVAGMMQLRDGTILVGEADPPAFHIRAITPDGTITSRPMPEGLFAPAVIAEEASGALLVNDYLLKKVLRWKDNAVTPAIEGTAVVQPGGLLALPDGSFYVSDVDKADTGNALYHVVNGIATKIAGGHGVGFGGDGGPANDAHLDGPLGIVLDAKGDIVFCDSRNDRVRRIHMDTQTIETIAGQGGFAFNGTTPDDSLKEPFSLVFDSVGDLYVSDSGHNQIKRIEAAKLK